MNNIKPKIGDIVYLIFAKEDIVRARVLEINPDTSKYNSFFVKKLINKDSNKSEILVKAEYYNKNPLEEDYTWIVNDFFTNKKEVNAIIISKLKEDIKWKKGFMARRQLEVIDGQKRNKQEIKDLEKRIKELRSCK